MWPEDRRVMVLWVNEGEVLEAIQHYLSPCEEVRNRLIADINLEGVRIVRVTHDVFRRAFGFLLSHPTFDPVPDGGIPPTMNDRIRWGWRVPDEDTPHLVS